MIHTSQKNFTDGSVEVEFLDDCQRPIATMRVGAVGERASTRPATFYKVESAVRIERDEFDASSVVMEGDTREATVRDD